MTTRNISHIAWVLFLILSSCIEDYNPKLTEYEDLFVVDGRITNEEGPQTVRLFLNLSLFRLNMLQYRSQIILVIKLI